MYSSLWIPSSTKSNTAVSFSLVIFIILLFTMHSQQIECNWNIFLKSRTVSNRFHSRWKYLKITVRTISALFNCFIVICESRKTPLFEAFRITITTCRLINTKMIYSVVLMHCQVKSSLLGYQELYVTYLCFHCISGLVFKSLNKNKINEPKDTYYKVTEKGKFDLGYICPISQMNAHVLQHQCQQSFVEIDSIMPAYIR